MNILDNKRIWSILVITCLMLSVIGVCSLVQKSVPSGVRIYHKDGKFGIKDGDSIILPVKYLNIEFIDSTSNIALLQSISPIFHDTIFYIYDFADRKFLYNDSMLFAISEVEMIGPDKYKLVHPGGHWFATLKVSQVNTVMISAKIIPHFNDSCVPLKDFLINGISSFMMHTYSTWTNMKRSNPRAFRILERILAMSGEECSPDNDLTFAQAVEYFIEEDARYMGDYDTAFDEIKAMIKALDNDGREDMTEYGIIKRLLSKINLSRSYIQMITDYPIYRNEYIAWHNLIETITYYYNYIIHEDEWSYQRQREADLFIGSWLDNRKYQLFDERKILMKKKINFKRQESLKTQKDIRAMCSEYYSSTPGYYNPMWHEVYYAFNEWMNVRKDISRTLGDEISLLYDSYTSIVINDLYYIIHSLYGSEFMAVNLYQPTRSFP